MIPRWLLTAVVALPVTPVVLAAGMGNTVDVQVKNHVGVLLWLLTLSFSLVLFFTRNWMTKREKFEETLGKSLSDLTLMMGECEVRLVGVEERQAAAVGKISESVVHLDKILASHLNEEPAKWDEMFQRLSRLEGEQTRVRSERHEEREWNGDERRSRKKR